MGKIENVVINLQRKNAVFTCYDTIYGSLDFKIGEKIKLNSLKFYVLGESECHWNEHHGKKTRKIAKNNVYLKHEIDFLPKEEYGDNFWLNEGEYSYKFEIKLPQKLPSSLKHGNAETKYYLKAEFDVNWSLNKNYEKPFTIINQFEYDLEIKHPGFKRNFSTEKIYGLFCKEAAPVVAKLFVDRRCYLPGEEITFDVKINNPSSKPIKKLRVALVKEIKCIIGRKKRNYKKILVKQENGDLIRPRTDGEWLNGKLKVPLTEPSDSDSDLINIFYYVELEVSSSFFTLKFRVAAPVVLGAISDYQSETIEKLDENPFKEKK